MTLKQAVDEVIIQRLSHAFNNAPELEGPEVRYNSTYHDASLVDIIAAYFDTSAGMAHLGSIYEQVSKDGRLNTIPSGQIVFLDTDIVEFNVRVNFGSVSVVVSDIKLRNQPTGDFGVTTWNPIASDSLSPSYFPTLPRESRTYSVQLAMTSVA